MSTIDKLDIKSLKIFQALIRERNASRVASQVHLTQQAVSDHLRKLRKIFDDELFIRKSNGFIPTPTALRLGQKVDQVLADLEDLLRSDSFEPLSIASTYVIAATDYAQKIVIPDLLEKIRLLAPKLKIIIRDLDIDRDPELMQSGQVDLSITFRDFIPKSYPFMPLFTDHYVCVASKHTSLGQRKLSIEEIVQLPQIIVSQSRPSLRGSIDSWLEKFGFTQNIVISAPCFSVVPEYLEKTDAIAFLPAKSCQDDKLITLELDHIPEEFEVIVAWHSRSNQDPLHDWIIDLLKKQYSIK